MFSTFGCRIYSVMLFTVYGIVALLTFTHTLYGAKDK